MKKVVLLIVLFCVSLAAMAQDIIVKKEGDIIKAKVIELSETTIKYKSFDNLDGPVYSISIANVLAITYENGQKETFQNTEMSKVAPEQKEIHVDQSVSDAVLLSQIADLESRAKTIRVVGDIITIGTSLGVVALYVINTKGKMSFGNIALGAGLMLGVDVIGISITNALARPSENEAERLKKKMKSNVTIAPTILIDNINPNPSFGMNVCFNL